MNITFLPFPELKTERLLLRRLTLEDRYDLMWLRSDERVNKYLGRDKSMGITEATDFVAKINKNLEENRSGYWVICFIDDPKLIGTICLWNFEPNKDLVELGYELSPMYQGKGIMHEAAEKIIEYAFEVIQAKTITAVTDPDNTPSQKLLKRCGFNEDIDDADGQSVYFLSNSNVYIC